jgi:hypothetical protein
MQPNIRSIRANNVQPSGESIISNRGGVELIKQAGQKQQRFPSYADYLRYLKTKPYVQRTANNMNASLSVENGGGSIIVPLSSMP